MLVKLIGDGIKKRRKSLKITQPHLSELAGISVNSLYKIERGQANASLETIEKIINVLGLELNLKVKETNL